MPRSWNQVRWAASQKPGLFKFWKDKYDLSKVANKAKASPSGVLSEKTVSSLVDHPETKKPKSWGKPALAQSCDPVAAIRKAASDRKNHLRGKTSDWKLQDKQDIIDTADDIPSSKKYWLADEKADHEPEYANGPEQLPPKLRLHKGSTAPTYEEPDNTRRKP